jgi:alanine racemase
MQMPGGTRLEVNLDLLYENTAALKTMVAPSEILAVIKGDAYGHGAVMVARTLLSCGVWRFGLARLSEAVSLRRQGVGGEMIIIGYTSPKDIAVLLEHNIVQTTVDLDHARALSEAAVAAGGCLPVHIKIDTGMGRLGIDAHCPDVLKMLSEICSLPGLRVEGCFTHLSSADEGNADSDDFTRDQIALFNKVTRAARQAGLDLGLLHACNSSGTLRFPEAHYQLVRPASLILGLDPMPAHCPVPHPFVPVGAFVTEIALIKTLPAGRAVSYGRIFYTARPSRIATLPVGYADGLPRALSNGGEVLIRGRRAPIVGRVCMDQTMVDVTDIPDAQLGDRVTLMGPDGTDRITATELAVRSGGGYVEVVSRIGRRVPICYIKEGRMVAMLDYMAGGLSVFEE